MQSLTSNWWISPISLQRHTPNSSHEIHTVSFKPGPLRIRFPFHQTILQMIPIGTAHSDSREDLPKSTFCFQMQLLSTLLCSDISLGLNSVSLWSKPWHSAVDSDGHWSYYSELGRNRSVPKKIQNVACGDGTECSLAISSKRYCAITIFIYLLYYYCSIIHTDRLLQRSRKDILELQCPNCNSNSSRNMKVI